jgi:Copine
MITDDDMMTDDDSTSSSTSTTTTTSSPNCNDFRNEDENHRHLETLDGLRSVGVVAKHQHRHPPPPPPRMSCPLGMETPPPVLPLRLLPPILPPQFRIRLNISNLPILRSVGGGSRMSSRMNSGGTLMMAPDTFVVVTSSEHYEYNNNDDDNNDDDTHDGTYNGTNIPPPSHRTMNHHHHHHHHHNMTRVRTGDSGDVSYSSTLVTTADEETVIGDDDYWGRTEVVYASYHPQYTTTIPLPYNMNDQNHTIHNDMTSSSFSPSRDGIFYVHVFRQWSHHNNNHNHPTLSPPPYCYGTAQFNIRDILSTKHRIRMKRLRLGNQNNHHKSTDPKKKSSHPSDNKDRKYLNTGCVFCQLERVWGNVVVEEEGVDHPSSSSSSSLPLVLQLQFQVKNLIPRHRKRIQAASFLSTRVSSTGRRRNSTTDQSNSSIHDGGSTTSTGSLNDPSAELGGLDTIVEIAKPMPGGATTTTTTTVTQSPTTATTSSDNPTVVTNPIVNTNGGWVVVHRSIPVLASFHPLYNVALIYFEDLYRDGDERSSTNGSGSGTGASNKSTNDHRMIIQQVLDQPIRISVYAINSNSHDVRQRLVGLTQTTIRQLLSMSTEDDANDDTTTIHNNNNNGPSGLNLQRNTKKTKVVGTVHVRNAGLYDRDGNRLQHSTLFNNESVKTAYWRPPQLSSDEIILTPQVKNACISCHVHLCVAIDFTSSNGYPYDPSSYHYQSKTSSLNDYEETIVTIGNALFGSSQFQCHKSSIPVWGFGAKYDGTVRHIFQCGSTPTVDGVSGVLDAYQSVFESDFIMSGPTIYTQVLQAAASKAKRLHDAVHEQSQYVVLLVITDGVMDNYDETIERLNAYRTVPLSIIFVGIGRCDFTKMYNLRNDHCHGKSVEYNNNERMMRSMITFVEFREHQQDVLSLGDAALRNIPHQIHQYEQLQCN